MTKEIAGDQTAFVGKHAQEGGDISVISFKEVILSFSVSLTQKYDAIRHAVTT